MIDKLIEFIISVLEIFKCWEIIDHYDRGVRLRFGKQHKGELDPGLHWKWPFYIDSILTIMVKATTMPLKEQTVTTLDGTVVVVKAVIKYEIKDAVKILLEVNDAVDAVADMTQGIIREQIIERNYDTCNNTEFGKEITMKARREAEKWGVKIQSVTLTDFGKMTSIRLLNTPVQLEST